MTELHDLTALELVVALRRGEVGPVDAVAHYLDRIDRLDGGLGAFVTVTPEAALARARALEEAGAPDDGVASLWGLPSADKDLVARAGVRTTWGSRVFADAVPEVSDELADVLDAAGAVSLGKTNTSEFGLAGYTEPAVARAARTPWRPALGAGGSSGGAAVAVSAGLLPVATGSDGGGSIRIPAAATGLVGLKPSRGRVPSGSGFTSLGGLAVHGALARTVSDAALLLEAMVHGGRSRFATQAPGAGGWLDAASRPIGRLRIGVMTTSPWDDWTDIRLAPEARDALEVTVAALTTAGHELAEVTLTAADGYPQAFHTVWQCSAASLPVEGEQLELLEPLTRWLVLAGRGRSARDLGAALRRLTDFERDLIAQFSPWDAVLTPTLATVPPPVGWYDSDDGERNFEQQVQVMPFTSMVNVAGLPAVSLPVHLTGDGVPMGVQLIGRPGGEDVLFGIGGMLEAAFGWQHRHPPQW